MLKSQHFRGFTLVELMITLAVVAIVVSIAAPSMGQFIRENRATTQANNLMANLQTARSEAINRGVRVSLRRTSPSNNVWEDGWIMFTDWNANGAFDGNAAQKNCSLENQDCLLIEESSLPNGMTLRTRGNYAEWLSFLPSGQIRSSGGGLANDTFTLCAPMTNMRQIIVSPGGRARVVEGDSPCS